MKKIMYVFMLIIALCLTVSLSSATENPFKHFDVKEDFQTSIVAGSEYNALFTFSSSCNTNISIVCLIQHPKLNETEEWMMSFILDDEIIHPNETAPGIFIADSQMDAAKHILQVKYYALPAVVPGNYNFTLSLSALVESVTKEVVHSNDNGNHGWRFFLKTINETSTVIIDDEEITLEEVFEEVLEIPEVPNKLEEKEEEEPDEDKTINSLSIIFVITSIAMAAVFYLRVKISCMKNYDRSFE